MTMSTSPPSPTDVDINGISQETLGQKPDRIESFSGGAWSHAFGLDIGGNRYVLRFSKIADDFRRDEIAARFAGPNLPIPRVHGIGEWEHGWWCISKRVPGRHLDTLSSDELLATLPSLAAMLIAMRETNANELQGYGSWNSQGNGVYPSFEAQLLDVAIDSPDDRQHGGSNKLTQHPQAEEVFARGYELLKSLTRYLSRDRAMIHMDTLNFNVNVEGNHIRGIYDWGCAMWGDPVYDLAWFRFWEPWYPQWAGIHLADRLIRNVGILGPHADERMHVCMLHMGLSHIRYHAFIENSPLLDGVTSATLALIEASV